MLRLSDVEAQRSRRKFFNSLLGLAGFYNAQGERIPALLAYARFLLLEPNSARSTAALASISSLLGAGISEGEGVDGEKSINISISDELGEGNFIAVEMALSLIGVSKHTDSVPKSEFQRMEETLKSTFSVLGEIDESNDSPTGFATTYYVPYFRGVYNSGFVEVMVRAILFGYDDPEAKEWFGVEENLAQLERFFEWSEGFKWSGKS